MALLWSGGCILFTEGDLGTDRGGGERRLEEGSGWDSSDVLHCAECVRDSRAESTAGECCSFSKRLCACDVFVFWWAADVTSDALCLSVECAVTALKPVEIYMLTFHVLLRDLCQADVMLLHPGGFFSVFFSSFNKFWHLLLHTFRFICYIMLILPSVVM